MRMYDSSAGGSAECRAARGVNGNPRNCSTEVRKRGHPLPKPVRGRPLQEDKAAPRLAPRIADTYWIVPRTGPTRQVACGTTDMGKKRADSCRYSAGMRMLGGRRTL